MYINNNNVAYFDSFGVEHIPKEIKKLIVNKNVITNIYRIQKYDSIICGYFRIGFIDFMLKSKSLLDYTNCFLLIIMRRIIFTKIFSITKKMKKLYCVNCGKYRKFEKLQMSYLLEKTLVLSIICSKCKNDYEKFFKEEKSVEILKTLGLIENIRLL